MLSNLHMIFYPTLPTQSVLIQGTSNLINPELIDVLGLVSLREKGLNIT